jgi:hypothetical protein
MEVSTCRQDGGPIPFTSLVEYFKIYGEDGDEFDDFLHILRAMDSTLLGLMNKKTNTPVKGRK